MFRIYVAVFGVEPQQW